MKVSLEGTSQEVMELMSRMVGVGNSSVKDAPTPSAPTPPPDWVELVEVWNDGFSEDGNKHWSDDPHVEASTDKSDKLRRLSFGSQSGRALKWVEYSGGLTHAVQSLLRTDPKRSRAIAVNMAQVASIVFPELADALEHFDPYEE
jgi:hypothetical protein